MYKNISANKGILLIFLILVPLFLSLNLASAKLSTLLDNSEEKWTLSLNSSPFCRKLITHLSYIVFILLKHGPCILSHFRFFFLWRNAVFYQKFFSTFIEMTMTSVSDYIFVMITFIYLKMLIHCSILVTMEDPFEVFLILFCKYFTENCCIYDHRIN